MLIDELESDGKLKVGALRERYKEWVLDENFPRIVAEAVASGVEDLEYNGGSLLKEHLVKGGRFPAEDWELVIGGLSSEMHWTCQISVCRALDLQPEAFEVDTVAVALFLRDSIDRGNNFVKAWAVAAFWKLAKLYPDYGDEAEGYRAQGLESGEKSVMARMRALR